MSNKSTATVATMGIDIEEWREVVCAENTRELTVGGTAATVPRADKPDFRVGSTGAGLMAKELPHRNGRILFQKDFGCPQQATLIQDQIKDLLVAIRLLRPSRPSRTFATISAITAVRLPMQPYQSHQSWGIFW